ncbi:unnamed protein product [Prunus armeniaca]|uniref:Uncharacterized protein n=1 Tax=Prunus armeniaca TaxID=36596 RepID=A0A6J5W331_PRUAR|nr:unnamed protein product [Prunus armeniaca]
MTTADTLDNTRNPIRAYRHGDDHVNASPFDMGAGHINPNKAFDSGVPPEAEAHRDQFSQKFLGQKHDQTSLITKGKRRRRYLLVVGGGGGVGWWGGVWGLEMEDDEGRWVMSGAAEAKAAEIRVFQVMKTMEDTYAGN